MIAISVWAINEGGMMLYYILFAGLLFAPFAIVSIFSLLDLKKHRKTIQGGIWLGTFLLLAPSYALPFFYDLVTGKVVKFSIVPKFQKVAIEKILALEFIVIGDNKRAHEEGILNSIIRPLYR